MQAKSIGTKGEDLGAHYLLAKGYRILENNFRCRAGEIDLIAEQKGKLIFVEVKTRSSSVFGFGEESIDARKQRRLKSVMREYLAHSPRFEEIQCDALSIFLDADGMVAFIKHFENIFPDY